MPYIELLANMRKRRTSGNLPDIRAIERFIKTEVDESCYGYAVIMERFQELKMCKKDDADQVWKKYDAWRGAIRIAELKALWPLAFAIVSMYPLALIAKLFSRLINGLPSTCRISFIVITAISALQMNLRTREQANC